MRDQRAVLVVASQANAHGRTPSFRSLQGRASLPRRLPLDFRARHRRLDSCKELPSVCRQVRLAVGGDEKEAAFFRCIDPIFELTWLARKSVEVPTEQSVE